MTMRNPMKLAKAARSFVRLVRDPARLEEVFGLADSVESSAAAEEIAREFTKDPIHAKALRERPRLGEVDLAALSKLPLGTLGRSFADDMIRQQLDPKDIIVPPAVSDYDFVRAHLRETHDLWHTVTGFHTDVAGELGLQAFYLAQFRAPLAALLLMVGFANTLIYAMDDKDRRMREIARGWLLGKRARTFFGVRWNEMWELPLIEVRRRLRVDTEIADRFLDAFVSGMPMDAGRAMYAA
jgi:ubiquinone biosynthesis protein COQ4